MVTEIDSITGRMVMITYYDVDEKEAQSCMHDQCYECSGTGQKRTGGMCIHMLSCPCPKCSPTC